MEYTVEQLIRALKGCPKDYKAVVLCKNELNCVDGVAIFSDKEMVILYNWGTED